MIIPRRVRYFITIVTKDRQPLFGEVVNGEMVLNEFGRIVDGGMDAVSQYS